MNNSSSSFSTTVGYSWMRTDDDVKALLAEINKDIAVLMIPVIVLIVLMMVVGIAGNALAFFIYVWRWQSCTMRIFLIYLAAVDLINCFLTMPVEIYILTHFFYFPSAEVCCISRFITYVTNNSSAVIFVAIAIDRYIRICHPHKKNISVSDAQVTCILALVIGACMSWPALMLYGTKEVPIKHSRLNETISGILCGVRNKMDKTPYPLVFYIILWCGFSTSVFILLLLYVKIGQVILKRHKKRSLKSAVQITCHVPAMDERRIENKTATNFLSTESTESKGISSSLTNFHNGRKESNNKRKHAFHFKTTQMLFAVTTVFVISFLPFLIIMIIRQRVGPRFYPSLSPGEKVLVSLFSRSYLIYSCANPILYGMCNSKFRTKAAKIFHIYTNDLQCSLAPESKAINTNKE